MSKRIGIFRGTFDPIHAGHVAFALQAMKHAKLDEVHFVPETSSDYKKMPEHYAHRYAMIEKALKQYPKLKLYKVASKKVTIHSLLPALRRDFPDSRLVFLMGSDVAASLPQWADLKDLCVDNELVISMRAGQSADEITAVVESLPFQPASYIILDSHYPEVNSSTIRQALRRGHPVQGLLESARRYILVEWLYVSLSE